MNSVTIESNDGTIFPNIDKTILLCSEFLGGLMRFKENEEIYKLEEVDGYIFSKILDWCTYVRQNAIDNSTASVSSDTSDGTNHKLTQWEEEFLNVSDEILLELIYIANYYYIPSLLEVTTTKIARRIVNYSTDYIRQLFHIDKNDFWNPEELEQLNAKIGWADV